MKNKSTKEFFEYCWSFYGKGGIYAHFFNNKLTKKELLAACQVRMQAEAFEGDSFDRECVREILLTAYNPKTN